MREFTVIGISQLNGEFRVRYANSMGRVRHLERMGHLHVKMWPLPGAAREEDCVDWLLAKKEELTETAYKAVLDEARRLGFLV